MTTHKPSVVFLCVHDAGRSQVPVGWLEHLLDAQVEVFSGGSNPGSEVNPTAVAGIDIADAFPKAWTEDVLRAADVIITMPPDRLQHSGCRRADGMTATTLA